jgi:hypothetical protein
MSEMGEETTLYLSYKISYPYPKDNCSLWGKITNLSSYITSCSLPFLFSKNGIRMRCFLIANAVPLIELPYLYSFFR